MSAVLSFSQNLRGRDLIVGDIHGHFSKLRIALQAVGFNTDTDRLFSVGDLVDRGPESGEALRWLAQPWFKAVRGNHEEAAMLFSTGQLDVMRYRGAFSGGWNIDNAKEERELFSAAFGKLPVAIEIQTTGGLVGIVHADCPTPTWGELVDRIGAGEQAVIDYCLWSRDRIYRLDRDRVGGVSAVVVGHTPVDRMTSLGNVIYIDTKAWMGGNFTILDAATLLPASADGQKLSWSE